MNEISLIGPTIEVTIGSLSKEEAESFAGYSSEELAEDLADNWHEYDDVYHEYGVVLDDDTTLLVTSNEEEIFNEPFEDTDAEFTNLISKIKETSDGDYFIISRMQEQKGSCGGFVERDTFDIESVSAYGETIDGVTFVTGMEYDGEDIECEISGEGSLQLDIRIIRGEVINGAS